MSHGRVQDRVKVLSSSKILPKEGLDQAPRLPPTPPLSAHLHWPKSFIFLVFFKVFSTFLIFFASWFVLVSKRPPRRLQDALKSLQDALKSLQDAPRCLQDTPVGGQKTLIFLVFFKVFDVQGLPGAILARHGLQDDFKSPWNVFHGFQDAFRNLSDGSKGLQDTPKSLQDAPKTRPREVQKSKISSCCSICSLS